MSELKRLIDDPDSDLDRLLLESALDDSPPEHAAERTLAALGLGGAALGLGAGTIGAGSGSLATGLASKGGLFGGALLKWASVVAVAGVVMGGGYALTRSTPTLEAPATQGALALQPTEQARERSWTELAPRHVDAFPREGAPLRPGASPRRVGVSSDGAPSSPRSDGATGREPSVASVAKGASGSGGAVPVREGAPGKKTAVNVEALDDEIALIDQARRALIEGHYDACLARLSAYQTRFPHGQLAAEAANMGRIAQQKKSAAAPAP